MADEIFIVDRINEGRIGWRRNYDLFELSLTGNGYFSGKSPNGITSIKGVPTSASVRVLLRTNQGAAGDGAVIASTVSAANGTWRINGIPLGFKYDIVARVAGEKDVIVSNVSPATM